jgi:hypothetical protein
MMLSFSPLVSAGGDGAGRGTPGGYGLWAFTGDGRRRAEEVGEDWDCWEVGEVVEPTKRAGPEEEEEEEEEEERSVEEAPPATADEEDGWPCKAGHTSAAPPAEWTIGIEKGIAVPSAMLVKRARDTSGFDAKTEDDDEEEDDEDEEE